MHVTLQGSENRNWLEIFAFDRCMYVAPSNWSQNGGRVSICPALAVNFSYIFKVSHQRSTSTFKIQRLSAGKALNLRVALGKDADLRAIV